MLYVSCIAIGVWFGYMLACLIDVIEERAKLKKSEKQLNDLLSNSEKEKDK